MITYCENCDNVTAESRSKPSYAWTCIKHPRVSGAAFVVRGVWERDTPHLRCADVNGGMCPLFEERKDNGTPKS